MNSIASFEPEFKIYDANGNRSLMRTQISEAIIQEYDLFFVIGSQVAQMAKELTTSKGRFIPIVFGATGDPQKLGLIKSVKSSGNHLTGSSVIGMDWVKQMIDVLFVLTKDVKKVFVPYNPISIGGAIETYLERFEQLLKERGVEVRSLKIYNIEEVVSKSASFIQDADLVLVLPDATLIEAIDSINRLCEKHAVPVYVAANLDCAKRGASMSFGCREYDVGVYAAHQAEEILGKGVHPSHIPIITLESGWRFMLNLDAARKQGLLDIVDPKVLFLIEHGEVI